MPLFSHMQKAGSQMTANKVQATSVTINILQENLIRLFENQNLSLSKTAVRQFGLNCIEYVIGHLIRISFNNLKQNLSKMFSS